MQRSKEHLRFNELFDEIANSNGNLCFPNIQEVEDPQEGLNLINRTSPRYAPTIPYYLRIQNFDPPRNGVQTHEAAWYAKIFKNAAGMGSGFDGSGVILASPRNDGKARVFKFAMCEHDWDESGANHSRGWHPKVCKKCGFNASIDSGD